MTPRSVFWSVAPIGRLLLQISQFAGFSATDIVKMVWFVNDENVFICI